MKIVFLSTYSGPVNRGIESWVLEVCNRLSQNHEVYVFQLGEASGKEKYNVKQIKVDVDWSKGDSSGKISNLLLIDYFAKLLFRFTKASFPEIEKIKPDIIVPLNGGWQTILCKYLSIKIKSKLVWVGHFTDPYSLITKPDLYIAITPKQFDNFFTKKYLKSKLIPNGVDIEKFKPEGNKFEHGLKHPVVLYVGALTGWKNTDKTILAVSKLKDVSLLMVGDGEQKYIELGEKLLGERFKHVKAKFEDMPNIYRSADIFTLCSKKNREAFGLVYLEAMSSGLPIVATDDKTRRFVIEKNGIYVSNPENIDEYAKAIRELLDSKNNFHPRTQAEKFQWDNIVKDYEECFNLLIK